MLKGVVAFFGVILVPASIQAQGAIIPDQCKDILRGQGAFNTEYVNTSGKAYSEFLSFQCASNFKKHDEATSFGMGLDTILYGVPIIFDGTFDQTEVDEWKAENCSKVETKASSETALLRYVHRVSPTLASTWLSCMKIHGRPADALSCEVEKLSDRSVLEIKWLRTTGDTSAPIIQNWSILDGACKPDLNRGDPIPEAGVQLSCTYMEKSDFVALLDTQRGNCRVTVAYEPVTHVFSGAISLTSPATILAEKVYFSSDARIQTNGYPLTIKAEDGIEIESDAEIRSFGDRKDNTSPHGRSAGTISFHAPTISGGTIRIWNRGEDGTKPPDVARAGTGKKGESGRGGIWKNFEGCVERRDGARGGGGKRAQKAILAAMAAMVATSSSISINGIRMNCSRTSSLKVLRAADPASREIADAAERGGKAEHRMSHAVQDAGAPQEGLGDRRAWQVSRVIRVKQGKTG